MPHKKYHIIGLGGTFDHFHIGHQYFLDFTTSLAEELRIGITTSDLTNKKSFPELIESYETREKNVRQYLETKKVFCQTFPLSNTFGPTLKNSPVEAISVTEMTKKGGQIINEERKRLGLSVLPIHVTDLLKDNTGAYISSTRIRAGEINRQGVCYAQLFDKDLQLTNQQKQFFRIKQGKIISAPSARTTQQWVVGDIALETFIQNGWKYDRGIFDQKNNRGDYKSKVLGALQSIEVVNAAGRISTKLVKTMQSSQKNIYVTGEEDLAAVAAVLLAPLESTVYYGQSGEGVIEMRVTEELKDRFYTVLAS